MLFTFLQLGKLLQGAAGLAHGHLQGSSKSERERLYHLSSHSVSFAGLQAGCVHSLSKISASQQEGWLEGWPGTHCHSQHSAVPGARLLSLPACSLNPAGRNPSCWHEGAESPFLCGVQVGEARGELACTEKSPRQLGGTEGDGLSPSPVDIEWREGLEPEFVSAPENEKRELVPERETPLKIPALLL